MSLDFAESQYTLEISDEKVIWQFFNCSWAGNVLRRISLCCISLFQMMTMELRKCVLKDFACFQPYIPLSVHS